MNLRKHGKIILILVFIVFILFLLLKYLHHKARSTFIGKSTIHGNGVFSDRDFEKGEIILFDIFPNKPKGVHFYENVSLDMFNKSISIEGKNINHCSKNYNADVVTKDYQTYKLIAIKKIKEGTEITANYDRVHLHYPFISRSHKQFVSC